MSKGITRIVRQWQRRLSLRSAARDSPAMAWRTPFVFREVTETGIPST